MANYRLIIGKALQGVPSSSKMAEIVASNNKLANTAAAIAHYSKITAAGVKLASKNAELVKVETVVIKGINETGSQPVKLIPRLLKEASTMLRKWKEALEKYVNSPQGKQFVKNVEESKIYDQPKNTTYKPINPYYDTLYPYNKGGSMKI